MPLFCSYHILTSSVIYYWTDARQLGIYSLNKSVGKSIHFSGSRPNIAVAFAFQRIPLVNSVVHLRDAITHRKKGVSSELKLFLTIVQTTYFHKKGRTLCLSRKCRLSNLKNGSNYRCYEWLLRLIAGTFSMPRMSLRKR